ncbi:MAG: TetR/AcrR family transcriptional regulator [Betaproteobacteria bacterium]|nr:TetR/AcrR family transcriptional regulator [Betaproteobacteria bacterium]NDD14887.1 TetR/AcrR family transcriptional regulator [Betaproteobacteria bacterium]
MPSADKPTVAAKPRKSAVRRQEILRHATALFDRKGYAYTSLDDVAQAVGIKREALYYYFRSRTEILIAIVGPQTSGLIDGMQAVLSQTLPAQEKLRLAIRNHLQRFDRHCLEMTIFLRDGVMGGNEELHVAMRRVWKDYESMWTRLIDEGKAAGEISDLGDSKMIAFGILGMCNWLARWYNPRKSAPIDSIIDTYFAMLSQGLQPMHQRAGEPSALTAPARVARPSQPRKKST